MEERLQKLLAAAGVASRREAEDLISQGRVAVDGIVVTQPGTKADPARVVITVDGKRIDLRPKLVYILLNKPNGYTSTRRDPHAARVVTDLVKDAGTTLYPVGRLDVNTEGLLLLTNDGDFANKITHPRHHVPKTYRARVHGLVSTNIAKVLAAGIELEDGLTAPAEVSIITKDTIHQESILEIVLTEGKKRQIRRMLDAVGHPVMNLIRTNIGKIGMGKLKPGEWRFLTEMEVEGLRKLAL